MDTKIEIKSRWDASVLWSFVTSTLHLCLEAGVKAGANLAGANLAGAYGIKCLPVGDPRGYRPVAVQTKTTWRIAAGCRWFTIAEAKRHWGEKYNGDAVVGAQYVQACVWLEAQIQLETTTKENAV